MTVQHDHPAAATTATPDVRLPGPRSAGHDAAATAPRHLAHRQPGAWGSEEDRKVVRWLGTMMIVLSLYCTAFLWIATKVWT